MIAAALVLAAWAIGLAINGWQLDHSERKMTTRPARLLDAGARTRSLLICQEQLSGEPTGNRRHSLGAQCQPGQVGTRSVRMFDGRSQVATARGGAHRARTNVPRPRDRVNASPRVLEATATDVLRPPQRCRAPYGRPNVPAAEAVRVGWLRTRGRPFRRSSGPGPRGGEPLPHTALGAQ